MPPGDYTVKIRGIDNHDQATTPPAERHVTVTHPPGNTAPVADFTVSCPAPGQAATATNVCEFDGRTSTDENAATLAYSWNYGNGTGSGALNTRTYTTANTYTVTLTVTDEWGATSAPVSKTVTITEPTDNVAPTTVFNPPSCRSLTCNFSGVGSADSNTGDTFAYKWDFGTTPASTSTSSAPSKTFPGAGTYTVTLTTTDGWGKASSETKVLTFTEPADNVAPTGVITPTCTSMTCSFSSAGTVDPNPGDTITYRWNFGTTAMSESTSTNPSARTFPGPGTYTVTLTTTDGWGKASSVTRDLTFTEPADNAAPVPVINAPTCTNLTCSFSSAGTADPNAGDTITYLWDFGTTALSTSTSANPTNRTFPADGTYTVTLTAKDGWGKSASVTREITFGTAPPPP